MGHGRTKILDTTQGRGTKIESRNGVRGNSNAKGGNRGSGGHDGSGKRKPIFEEISDSSRD